MLFALLVDFISCCRVSLVTNDKGRKDISRNDRISLARIRSASSIYLTQNSNGHEYTWDFDNMMSGANIDGQTGDDVTFAYDALGRRVRKKRR